MEQSSALHLLISDQVNGLLLDVLKLSGIVKVLHQLVRLGAELADLATVSSKTPCGLTHWFSVGGDQGGGLNTRLLWTALGVRRPCADQMHRASKIR